VALPPEPSPEPQGGHVRPPPAPPPADWRTAAGDARPPSGVGLGLFGMRPVPMVGRDAERDTLWGWLLQVRRARSPGLAVLRGPRGEGKTRLAEWLAETADETGAAVVLRGAFGTGAERDGVAGMVADHYHLPPARGPDTAWAWLVRAGAVDGTDADEARRLAYVVTAAAEPRGPARASPDDRAAVIGRLARRAAGARAVVVVLDDLDQDPDALGLAARLLAQPDLPALIVATVSDGAALGPLAEPALDHTLDLRPLPPADGVALVRGLLPVSPQIARRVEEQSGGHPLVAVQLVSHWVERGWVRSGDGGFDVVRGASGPRALARLWGERIVGWSGRDPRVEDTLLAAAVLGRVVDRAEWAAVARELELPDPEPLLPRLAELGLGQPAGARPHPFVFAHGLLRDIVLERAGVVRCGVVHRAAARALGATGAGVERRGLHLLAGGDLVGAWPLLVTAAQIRLRCGEPEGALAALARLEAAAGPLSDSDVRRAELDAERAQVHRLSGRFVEAAALAERAAAVPGVAPNVRIKALRELSVLLQYTSRDPRVQPLLDEAFAVAEVAGLHDQLPALWIQRGRALEYGGRLAEAREAYLAGRRLALAGTPSGSDGDDAELGEVLVGLASVAHKLGDLAEATIAAQDALTRFRARHLTWHEIWAETLLGELHRASGDLSGAEAAYRGAIARYDALSAGQSALPRANLALVLLARGAWREALDEASRARDDARAAGHENLARMVSLFVAWAAAGVGRWDLVEDGLATASDLVERGLCDPDLRHAAEQAAATCAAGGRPELAAAARAIAEAQARALSPAPVSQGQG
jgi:tetratricopeptide (TPR) repeat protein